MSPAAKPGPRTTGLSPPNGRSTPARELPDPLLDPDVDGVARLLADRLPQRRLDRKPVGAVALGHERADERFAVDRSADLHEPAGAEQLSRVVHHHARPRTGAVTLLKLRVELSEHGSQDSRTRRSEECSAC